MKKIILSIASLCALFAAPSLAEAAVRGFATGNVNMRSGPSTAYPAVVVIPVGASLTINGCMSTVNWCDVSFAGGRGWVSGNYIQASYRSNRVYVAPDYYRGLGIPSVTFDVGTYWGRYYRDRDFYRDRDRWRGYDWRSERPLPPPPRPPRWDRDDPRPPPGWDRDRDRFDRDRDDRRPPPPRFDRGDDRRPPPPNFERGDDRRPPPPNFDRGDDRRPPQPRADRGDDRRPPPPRAERENERRNPVEVQRQQGIPAPCQPGFRCPSN